MHIPKRKKVYAPRVPKLSPKAAKVKAPKAAKVVKAPKATKAVVSKI